MIIKKADAIELSFTEFYERDALAITGGAEHNMVVLLVRVETTNGMVGYGESVSYGGIRAISSGINDVLSELVVGEDSCEIRRIWDKMYKATYRIGRRGAMISGMSGIDIALWDLLGKELGAPIYKLLGGSREKIKGYVTGGYYREGKDISQLIDEVSHCIDAGFDTVKIKVGGLALGEDVSRIRAIRQTFGDKIRIAVDANNVYDFNSALSIGREFEKLGVLFFEEPILTDFPQLSSELARTLDVPIAGYETAYTSYEFRDLIQSHAIDIVQSDASWGGGITELQRIAVLARAFGFDVIPHFSAGGIGFAANLHVALAMRSPMIEYHLRPNPLREKLVSNLIERQSGYFLPLDKPGLGITVDEKVIEEFRKR